jgi:hypothetical protein
MASRHLEVIVLMMVARFTLLVGGNTALYTWVCSRSHDRLKGFREALLENTYPHMRKSEMHLLNVIAASDDSAAINF